MARLPRWSTGGWLPASCLLDEAYIEAYINVSFRAVENCDRDVRSCPYLVECLAMLIGSASIPARKDNIADESGRCAATIEPLVPAGVEPRQSLRSSIVPRQSDLNVKTQKPLPADENELEGRQDMGGKQGGQAGFPKPTQRPRTTMRDEDVVPKRQEGDDHR